MATEFTTPAAVKRIAPAPLTRPARPVTILRCVVLGEARHSSFWWLLRHSDAGPKRRALLPMAALGWTPRLTPRPPTPRQRRPARSSCAPNRTGFEDSFALHGRQLLVDGRQASAPSAGGSRLGWTVWSTRYASIRQLHQQVGMRNPQTDSASLGEHRLPAGRRHPHRHHQLIARRTRRSGMRARDARQRRQGPPHLTRCAMDVRLPTLGDKPFLNWNPTMGGYADAAAIGTPFAQMVSGVGQHGCGYEASLESIYRFLNEPDPYDNITIDKDGRRAWRCGAQRHRHRAARSSAKTSCAPTRSSSVIMVTDENDCSIIDGGQYFYVIVPPSGSPPKSFAHARHVGLQRRTPTTPAASAACNTTPTTRRRRMCGPRDDAECKLGHVGSRPKTLKTSAASTRRSAMASTSSIRSIGTSTGSPARQSPIAHGDRSRTRSSTTCSA